MPQNTTSHFDLINQAESQTPFSIKPLFTKFQIEHSSDPITFSAYYKKSGFRTHKVSEDQWGFAETLALKTQKEHFVVHRLDKETSGVILFAHNKLTAQKLSYLFENHLIQKTYYFLTDKISSKTNIHIESYIEKKDKIFTSEFPPILNKSPNAITDFEFIKKLSDNKYLWKAVPKTGKPHQIRLHARDSQIPILGDLLYGGSPYFRIALHAQKINFSLEQINYAIEAKIPFCFEQDVVHLGDFLNNELQELGQVYELNQLLNQSYRIYHRGYDSIKLRADYFNQKIWIYWYYDNHPTEQDINSLNHFAKKNNFDCAVRLMMNRGAGVGGKEKTSLINSPTFPEKWITKEHHLVSELRLDQGFSPGLFLDQRCNRHWVLKNSKNKNILNLFSYTSLFSVAAALGEAQNVTTVDASKNFLNWSKSNFLLNQLDPQKFEFFEQDSILFLQGSQKRDRKWDLIIADPPSFGRTKTTVWKIEKDFSSLMKLMWTCLNKNGQILFTCNYEEWSLIELKKQIQASLKSQKHKIENLEPFDLDFEFFDAYDNLLKGYLITKID